jgi:hypothetical protein
MSLSFDSKSEESLSYDSPSEEPLPLLLNSDDEILDYTHAGLPLPANPYYQDDFKNSDTFSQRSNNDHFFPNMLLEYSSILPSNVNNEIELRDFLLTVYDNNKGTLFNWNEELILNGDQYDLICLLSDFQKLRFL